MIKHIVFFLIGVAAIYFTAGFIVLDWNVFNWSIEGRLVFTMFFWLYAFNFGIFVQSYWSKK
jgi:hypothetical protein